MAKATARAKTKAAAASWVPQSREEVIRGIAGPGIVYRGVPATLRNNAHLPAAPLADAAGFDYRPRYDLRIVDQALPPGTATDLIAATLEYRHPAGTVARRGRRPDIGALEWDDSARPP